ncbi:hypothetical protein INT45_012715, partial [Circinella minor]
FSKSAPSIPRWRTPYSAPKCQNLSLNLIEDTIIPESPTVSNIDDLKRTWKSRLNITYNIVKNINSNTAVELDLYVPGDMWIELYKSVTEYMVNNDKQESVAYRRQVTSQLYKRTNGNFASELLNESEAASQEPLNQHRREAQQQQSEAIQEGTEQEEQQTAVDDDEDIGIEGLENPSEVGSEPITLKGQVSLESIARINGIARQIEPASLGECLDHLSYSLINSTLTSSNIETLKLSLSRVIYLIAGDTLKVFDKHFFEKDMNFKERYLQAKTDIPKFPTGMTAEMAKVFDFIAAEAKNGKLEARKLICNKKLEVFDSGENDNELMQMLDIVDVIIASLPDLNEQSSPYPGNSSELTHYRHVATLLDIIGETCSKATKIARQHNMELCKDKDNKQVVIGRRIDLLFSTLGVELGSSEWKKANVSDSLGKQQQNKNARTNKAILRTLERMPINEDLRDEMIVYGMDWIGNLGYVIAVKQVNSAYLVYFMGDLILPQTLSNFCDFKDTLDLLFSFKHHHQELALIVESAYHRQNAQATLRKYRTTSMEKRSPSPDTFFTPVKKQRKTKTIVINSDNDDIYIESDQE